MFASNRIAGKRVVAGRVEKVLPIARPEVYRNLAAPEITC
jgi:hypothetical protein